MRWRRSVRVVAAFALVAAVAGTFAAPDVAAAATRTKRVDIVDLQGGDLDLVLAPKTTRQQRDTVERAIAADHDVRAWSRLSGRDTLRELRTAIGGEPALSALLEGARGYYMGARLDLVRRRDVGRVRRTLQQYRAVVNFFVLPTFPERRVSDAARATRQVSCRDHTFDLEALVSDPTQVNAVHDALAATPGIVGAQIITSDETRFLYACIFRGDKRILGVVDGLTIPDGIELMLEPTLTTKGLDKLLKTLDKTKGVVAVRPAPPALTNAANSDTSSTA